LEVFVRSRWQTHTDKGHFWKPQKPLIAEVIENQEGLISDFNQSILLWHKYRTGDSFFCKSKIYLYIDGIRSPYMDAFNRPIKHAIIWRGNYSEEKEFRRIIYKALMGGIDEQLKSAIYPDKNEGFCYDSNSLNSFFRVVQLNSDCDPPGAREFSTVNELSQTLLKYKLPSHYGERLEDGTFFLSLAIGKSLSLSKLKETHGYIKWVLASNNSRGTDYEV
jgi:hypothetical protein